MTQARHRTGQLATRDSLSHYARADNYPDPAPMRRTRTLEVSLVLQRFLPAAF